MFTPDNAELNTSAQLLLTNASHSFENFNVHENKLANAVLEDLTELCSKQFSNYYESRPLLKRIYNTLYGLKINMAEDPYIMFHHN